MKISTMSRYGLRAIVYLAKTNKICSIREISQKENISYDFLEKIFAKLREAGLIGAKRGTQGGYFLTRSPRKITLEQIIKILEKPADIAFCLTKEKEKCFCSARKKCQTKDVWKKIQQAINSTLSSMTLADLINKKYEQKRKRN